MEWRLIRSDFSNGYFNMALDEVIQDACRDGISPPTVRFYGWSPPALSLGYAQKAEKEIDVEACLDDGLDIVRRLTGGKAVLHDRELTYSVICPTSTHPIPDDILNSYLFLAQGLLRAMRLLGVEAEICPLERARAQKPLKTASCFAKVSAYEIMVDGKKLIGSAQRRFRNVMLQHGSILIDYNPRREHSLYLYPNDADRERMIAVSDSRVTSLRQELKREVIFQEVAEALKEGLEAQLGCALHPGEPSPREMEMAASLVEEKYSTPEWNLERRIRAASP